MTLCMVSDTHLSGSAVFALNVSVFVVASIRQYRKMRTPWSRGRQVALNHGKVLHAWEGEERDNKHTHQGGIPQNK